MSETTEVLVETGRETKRIKALGWRIEEGYLFVLRHKTDINGNAIAVYPPSDWHGVRLDGNAD